jgi:hypothetical protein
MTPSITMVLMPIWATATPENSKERVQIAILKEPLNVIRKLGSRLVLEERE